ncbi:ArsR/SmtB family transcription factor [Vallicoccus soli]|uniref:ArsR family transcriptional regulator n=1 Tax=Vallicoccus soli TaxID=2339232 RepID=A0A3A3Z2N5_9ACTN|nr:helix-turn-helix domain-containing protein [Vallicoccus soli]RJK97694.1 ArsR family transcriptional regulator [Vallicoccus soli]
MATSYRVSDPVVLRAVAHPLRTRLLAHLRLHGPATASALARALGESSGATSYHLRQLARYGFVEPDPEQASRREKRWRARHDYTDVDLPDLADPEARDALDELLAAQQEGLREGLRRRRREGPGWPGEWQAAHASSDLLVQVTAEELADLKRRITALLLEHERSDDPAARRVVVHLHSFWAEGERP